MALIECRTCNEPNCEGCNQYILNTALKDGWFNNRMDEHYTIQLNEDSSAQESMELTLGEAESLLDFLEIHLISDIREDVDIDSLEWVANMISIWQKCKAIVRNT